MIAVWYIILKCWHLETQFCRATCTQCHSVKESTARANKPSSTKFSAFDLELLSSNRIHLLLCFLRRSQAWNMFLLLANSTGGWADTLISVCRIMPRAISRGMLEWSYYLKEAEHECNGWIVTALQHFSFSIPLLISSHYESQDVRGPCGLTADDV